MNEYQKKRDFSATSEPSGKKKAGAEKDALEFVVQKHQATRLHYDLRLELYGVLKSWAVPKGPSLNPADKRLAIQVEDHPFDYRTFEGTIPEGSYGAGDVIVWDAGTYEVAGADNRQDSEAKIAKDLEKGHLDIILHGKKLKGEFVLIRTKGEDGKQWLLMKKKDQYASDEDVTAKDKSILSHRKIAPKISRSKSPKEIKPRTPGKKQKMPAMVKPMLATLVDEPFNGKDWLYEIKWDGYRVLSMLQEGKVKLFSRSGQNFNSQFPSIVEELEKLSIEAWLDGEIVVLNEKGLPSFQMLQNYGRHAKGNLVYYVFDILYLNGKDLKSLPLLERKEILKSVLPENHPAIWYCDHISNKGIAFFKQAAKKGLEGIIAKRIESHYLEGKRSKSWLKIKTHLRQEAIICGFTSPKGSREYFGSLLLGVYENKVLTYVGHTGTGFDRRMLSNIYARLSPLIQPNCPFKNIPKNRAAVTWVKPELVCEVSFAEWTGDGHMRQAVFIDFREDKKPQEIAREKELSVSQATKNEKKTAPKKSPKKTSQKSELELTNLDKVFWPKEKYTKGDLIDYYRQVAPLILPYLKDRPESLRRYPNGIEKEGFFQKDASYPPEWMKTFRIHHHHENRDVNYYVVENEKGLLYLANLGCIDFNPFLSRIDSLEYPDYLVLDLDPEDISFDKVVEVALTIHEVLEKWEIPSVCKTSGKRGMHIYIPLGAKYKYEESVNFGKLIAYIVHKMLPDITSVERSPKDRQKKVYLDYLQNNFGQTVVAPYSVRATPGATVSTPLKWSEVKPGISPQDFTIQTVLPRFKKTGDLFKLAQGRGIDLKKILKKIEG